MHRINVPMRRRPREEEIPHLTGSQLIADTNAASVEAGRRESGHTFSISSPLTLPKEGDGKRAENRIYSLRYFHCSHE